ATADCFLLSKFQTLPSPEGGQLFEQEPQRLVQLGQGLFGEIEWTYVQEALEQEYTRILPIAQAGLKGLLGRSDGDSGRDSDSDSRPALQLDRDPDLSLPKPLSQAKPPQAQTRVRTVRSGSTDTTFLSRCKSFIKLLFS